MAWDESQYIIDETLKLTAGGKPTGIPPTNLGDNAKVTASNAKARIVCTTPPNTVLDGKTVCSVKGMMIVRKQGSAPVNQNDGTFVADIAAGEAFDHEDTGLTNGVEYYYGFFPYSYQNVFNINPANVRVATPQAYKIWAFDQNFNDLNPLTSITYPEGFENSDFAPMHTNKDTGTVTAGGWLPFLQNTLKNYPYMIKKTGEVDYALDPMDYSKKLSDGSPSEVHDYWKYDGGCFAWINKIWMREEYSSDGNSRRVMFSDGAAEGFIPVGFYDQDQNELEGVWIPMCPINSYDDERYRIPIFSEDTTPSEYFNFYDVKTNVDNFNRGVFFGGPIINVLRDLQFLMFRTTNLKNAAGYGNALGSDSSLPNDYRRYTGESWVVKVPGWYGSGDAEAAVDINLCFHSTIFTWYRNGIFDPYYLVKNFDIFVSPFYKYSVNGDTHISTTHKFDNQKTHYSSRLIKGPDYWGSIVDPNDNRGTSTTGFGTSIRLYCGNEPTTDTFFMTRFGHGADSRYRGQTFGEIYVNAKYTSDRLMTSVIILPQPGYSPFN